VTFPFHTVHIVSHTHWDREWYETGAHFRVHLGDIARDVCDRLEHEDGFDHFMFDGQVSILEDIIADAPDADSVRQQAERIAKHVGNGQLNVGPFHVLPDEFLIGAEGHVRNLLIGMRTAEPWGGAMRVGYLPDSFGHIAQMPQILTGFGIDAAVAWRGYGDELEQLGLDHWWQAPDGSRVLMYHPFGGYCNGWSLGQTEHWHAHTQRRLDPAHAVDQVKQLITAHARRSRADVMLILNGCDHHPPQRELAMILRHLDAAFPDITFRHSSLPAFFQALREAPAAGARRVHAGELLGARDALILSGIWSTRMPLKQDNQRALTWLAEVWEPLQVMSGDVRDRTRCRRVWKTWLLNQAHDSIGGCSVDDVHRDMDARSRDVQQTAETAVIRAMSRWCPPFARDVESDRDTLLCVVNPHSSARSVVLERLVVLTPECGSADQLALLDQDGRSVPMVIVSITPIVRHWGEEFRRMLTYDMQRDGLERSRLGPAAAFLDVRAQEGTTDRLVHVQWCIDDMPAMTHRLYSLTDHAPTGTMRAPSPVTVSGHTIDNGLIQLTMHADGTCDLFDHRTDHTWRGLNQLRDVADAGDGYDFQPLAHDPSMTPPDGAISVDATRLSATMEASFTWMLPRGLDEARTKRCTETVPCAVRVRMTVRAADPTVDVDVMIDNAACDHRLRAEHRCNCATDHIVSDGAFMVHRRPVQRPWQESWAQHELRTWPQWAFSALDDGSTGLAIFNRGLPEVEAMRNADDRTDCAITLLRCVGALSRNDLAVRRNEPAGPLLAAPEAQCPGVHRFQYALHPYSGSWMHADVPQAARMWATPWPAIQGVEDHAQPGGASCIAVSGKAVQVTAMKWHEDRDSYIVRLCNLAESGTRAFVETRASLEEAWITNLAEVRQEPVPLRTERTLELRIRAHEIATLELVPRDDA
jgi:mannosylglycerate hydrolase